MDNTTEIKQNVRKLMVENLMLQISPEEIGDDQPLFGPGSVGLDSVDALQLVVALDKTYGLKIADPEAAKKILQNVNSIADAVVKHQTSGRKKRTKIFLSWCHLGRTWTFQTGWPQSALTKRPGTRARHLYPVDYVLKTSTAPLGAGMTVDDVYALLTELKFLSCFASTTDSAPTVLFQLNRMGMTTYKNGPLIFTTPGLNSSINSIKTSSSLSAPRGSMR